MRLQHRMGRLEPEGLLQHLDLLHRVARGLCGSPHDAEDLIQETCVRVLTRPRLLRGRDERPYLLRALRNTYLTSLRTAGRRPRTVELPAEDSEGLRSSLAEPEIAIERVDLLETIAALPADLRGPLVAVDLLGFSYREAARALHTRETTINMGLFRARRRMAGSLKGDPGAAKSKRAHVGVNWVRRGSGLPLHRRMIPSASSTSGHLG